MKYNGDAISDSEWYEAEELDYRIQPCYKCGNHYPSEDMFLVNKKFVCKECMCAAWLP